MKTKATELEMEYKKERRETFVLDKAEEAVYERPEAHGDPEDSFDRIASMWSGYLDTQIEASDVANLMVLLKVARNAEGQYLEDNWVDIAGYAECGARLQSDG
jgi:hypothetical protein